MKCRIPAMLLLAGLPALAHRLDEYLQRTFISLEPARVDVQIALTPGVSVFPFVLAGIDTNADGVISESEQRAYAGRVLRDLSLSVDGRPLQLHLISAEFPRIEEMQEGLGEIRIDFDAPLPSGGVQRRLVFENRHHSGIAAYQVNCLVPRDPGIQIVAQNRDYRQSRYQVDYLQSAPQRASLALLWRSDDRLWLTALALLLFARVALLAARRVQRS